MIRCSWSGVYGSYKMCLNLENGKGAIGFDVLVKGELISFLFTKLLSTLKD